MSKIYVTGFPRIGEQRELKSALESYWAKKSDFAEVQKVASTLRARHWRYQKEAGIDFISCNDFSLYDNMLDTAVMLGAIPARFRAFEDEERYFAMARGTQDTVAMEMTKWFNTNYHYIVPELSLEDRYELDATKIVEEYQEAKALGITAKINLIGPLTFLGLSKRVDRGDPYGLFGKILPLYETLLKEISKLDERVCVQIDEPIFATDLDTKVLSLIKPCYDRLGGAAENVDIIVTSYFEHACEATEILVHTPIWGIGLDLLYGTENLQSLDAIAQSRKQLVAGVVDGRNIWRNDIEATLALLEQVAQQIPKERIIPATSCSLLHTPFTLRYEEKMAPTIKQWLSFAVEKLDELHLIGRCFFGHPLTDAQKEALHANRLANESRRTSEAIHDPAVQERLRTFTKTERSDPY